MNLEKLLYRVLVLISITTLFSGIVQVFAPALILGLVGGEINAATRQCFATIGMFMALFGGMLLHVLLKRQVLFPVFLYAGLQKVGAFVAVFIGVVHHVFAPLALAVAGFDLLSGILVFFYLKLANSPVSRPLDAAHRSLS